MDVYANEVLMALGSSYATRGPVSAEFHITEHFIIYSWHLCFPGSTSISLHNFPLLSDLPTLPYAITGNLEVTWGKGSCKMQSDAPQDKTSRSWDKFMCSADSTYVYLSLTSDSLPWSNLNDLQWTLSHIQNFPKINSTFVIFLSDTSILYVCIFVYYFL